MKIIVTGGAGFLGKHLCRSLSKAGHEVKVIDLRLNSEFPTVQADVRDAERMLTEIKDANYVFHLASLIEAGESVKEPQSFIDNNISGTVSVLEAMRQNGIFNFAFSSSAAIYGEPMHTPIKEDDRTLPINPYGMTKLAMEALLSSYVRNFGFTGIALRYFNLYGPEEDHQPETHAIPRFIQQIHTDSEVTIWGQGQHKRDYIHVSDVVTAHLKALELSQRIPGKYHYFNISAEKPASVSEVITLLEEIMGKSARRSFQAERLGDPLVLTADATKAHQELGWQANIPFKEGLVETVAFFLGKWEAQSSKSYIE